MAGLISFNRHENFEHILRIAVARRIKRLTYFYARLIACTLRILLLSMVIMFYIFASFKQKNMNNEIHWSCRNRDRKWPEKQKISRVETNYSPGSGRLNYNWVSWIKHRVGFHWVCYKGVSFRNPWASPYQFLYTATSSRTFTLTLYIR